MSPNWTIVIGRGCVVAWLLFSAMVASNAVGVIASASTAVFMICAACFQGALLTLPLLLCYGGARLSWRLELRGRVARTGTAVVFAVIFAATIAALWLDWRIYGLFGYHINGFVVNLVFTPGGLDALDASTAAWWTVGFGFLLGVAALYTVISHRLRRPHVARARTGIAVMLVAAALLGVVEKVMYGVAHLRGDERLVSAALIVPGYVPLTFQHFARSVGWAPKTRERGPRMQGGPLNYPLQPLDLAPVARPPNMIWLVAESLRADQLSPAVMPSIWSFSERNLRFEQHFSGGNNTRMGMFTLFYSLHGPYWFKVLAARRPPVLFDVLNQLGYDVQVYTSAKFSYPEFDRTIFSTVPEIRRHEFVGSEPRWQRDAINVDRLLESVDNRDPSGPFFRFMFFESTHASYYAPDNDGDVNYALLDPERDLPILKARYANAARYLDSQIARILDRVERDPLLEDTIVLITGDHGEEFMEHGRWGHGSTFGDEQLEVPMVLRIPGVAARVIRTQTTHLDIIPTLLPLLGVSNATDTYAQGYSVLDAGAATRKPWHVATQWTGIGIIDAEHIATMPLNGVFGAQVVARDTREPVSSTRFYDENRRELLDVMAELNRFVRR